MTTLYGIKNCDTVKKARTWLDNRNICYQFHDVRGDGLSREQVQQWTQQLGWQTLVNKRSTTWKQLDQGLRDTMDTDTAIDAMTQHPTLIKRPVLEHNQQLHVGFKADQYQLLFTD
ncbi:ArsC family reductase [bacterium SCSIO 12696]|nr:ArsC family reductase [bacterium SCSIO 12696]